MRCRWLMVLLCILSWVWVAPAQMQEVPDAVQPPAPDEAQELAAVGQEMADDGLPAEPAPPPPPAETILPPVNVTAADVVGDDGKALNVKWRQSATEGVDGYELFRINVDEADTAPIRIGRLAARATQFEDRGAIGGELVAGKRYRYQLFALKGELRSAVVDTADVSPVDNWLKWTKPDQMVLFWTLLICIAFPLFISAARRGKTFFIRDIAGLAQIDDAIGRATEMGRPILYVPGIGTIQDIATIASLTILGRVARKAAEYNTPLEVPVSDYLVLPIARETVKTEYLAAGRPDAFRPDSVYFVTTSQFAYVANICGTMKRVRPATNFFLGWFQAESLILAETGASTGAIQIAGTDSDTQLPFFITACDYTLIGEEFYAASAYLSREPVLMGTLKAQDFGKAMILAFLIAGTVLTALGWEGLLAWFPSK